MPPVKSKSSSPVHKTPAPVWRGPEEDGITFSLLSRFLTCRERFRLLVVEGLRPVEQFNPRMEWGNCWHVCEEAFAGEFEYSWEYHLKNYADSLCKKFPTQQEQVATVYDTVRVMFPIYVEYWAAHPDVVARSPLFQEQVFDVPYRLPSGRTVRLRGKWDAVDLIGKGKGAGVYLFETKTKSEVNEQSLVRQLTFDLQTMLYLVALVENPDAGEKYAKSYVKGVRYNVIRRPRQYQGKKESREGFFARLRGIVAESPGEFFYRWKVEVTPGDVANFRRRCLDPLLENLCNWWMVQTGALAGTQDHQDYLVNFGHHWQHPFGVRNVLDEGGATDLDEYLATGSTLGLERTDQLFRELR